MTPSWEPLLELAERVGAKMPRRMGNWLSPRAEALGRLPLVNRLCLSDGVVARMRERAEARLGLLDPLLAFRTFIILEKA